MITDDFCWADFRITRAQASGCPCLFLDRDGVLIEDTGYPGRAEDVILIEECLPLVRLAQDRGYVVGVVTNQSGLARGMFDWDAFSSIQEVIDQALTARGARIDFVLACPHHAEATVLRYKHENHAWRKPAPGMIVAAAEALDLDLASSIMIGDRTSDMEAARRAGVPHRALLVDEPGAAGSHDAWSALSRADLSVVVEQWCIRAARRPGLEPGPPHR